MPTDKLEKFKELLKVASESLTREEFTNAFKALTEFIKRAEKALGDKIDTKTQKALDDLAELNKIYLETIKRIEDDNQSTLSNLKKWVLEKVGLLFIKSQINEKLSERLNELNERMTNIRDGIDGVSGEPGLPGKDGKDGTEITPEQVRDKLESLSEEEKLSIEAIKDLRAELDELKKVRGRSLGGGGFSLMAMNQHFIDDETPAGAINGVNTDFVVNLTPSPESSLKVFVNGSRMRLTEDYTFSGKTITFVTAPPTSSIILVDYRS